MPAQVSREALGKLVQELSTKNFTSSVINRLRNEDPGSERYPDTQRLLNDAPEGDPLQTATKEQAASAFAEMKAGFSRWGKPLEK